MEILEEDPGWRATDLWSEPEPPTASRRPEAFSVAWCDIQPTRMIPPTLHLSFSGGGNLFFLGDATGFVEFDCFRPVYRIVTCYGIDPLSIRYPVHAWYCGNGWFGTRETIPESDQLCVTVLTSNSPDLFFARRGCVDGYEW